MVMLADASGRAGLDLPSTVPEAPDTPFATASDDAISIDARPESAGTPVASTGSKQPDSWSWQTYGSPVVAAACPAVQHG